MVSSNHGYPDPDKPTEDLSPNHDIIVTTDTDTDDDDNLYNDYQPLPTQEIQEVEEDTSSDVEEGAAENLPPIVSMEDSLVREVWTGAQCKPVDIVMDSDKVDEVKQAMVNFTLPPSSIPEWANNVPEEEWKQLLISRVQNMQK